MVYLIVLYTHTLLLCAFFLGLKSPLIVVSICRLCGLTAGLLYYFVYLNVFKVLKKPKSLKVFLTKDKLENSWLHIGLDILFMHTFNSCLYLRYGIANLRRITWDAPLFHQLGKLSLVLATCLTAGLAYYHWFFFKKYWSVLLNSPTPSVNMKQLYTSLSQERLTLPNQVIITKVFTNQGIITFIKEHDYTR